MYNTRFYLNITVLVEHLPVGGNPPFPKHVHVDLLLPVLLGLHLLRPQGHRPGKRGLVDKRCPWLGPVGGLVGQQVVSVASLSRNFVPRSALKTNPVVEGLQTGSAGIQPRIVSKPDPLVPPGPRREVVGQGGKDELETIRGDPSECVERVLRPDRPLLKL